jgi:putative tricarboxylic transport membrane protein
MPQATSRSPRQDDMAAALDAKGPLLDTTMKNNDAPIGVGLLVLGLAILWHVSSFPPAPGQPYNAALFPGIAAGGLVLAAIALIISGIRKNKADRELTMRDAAAAESSRGPDLDTLTSSQDVEVLETAKVPSRILAILLTAGSIGFYLLAANYLGFILTGAIILAVLMWAYGVAFKVLLPVSIIAALVIHVAFYKLLSVPLPWGLLQPFAW